MSDCAIGTVDLRRLRREALLLAVLFASLFALIAEPIMRPVPDVKTVWREIFGSDDERDCDNCSPTAPVIDGVSVSQTQTHLRVTIWGHHFGTNPDLVHLEDGTVRTNSCGDSPGLAIRNEGDASGQQWAAGHEDCRYYEPRGIKIVSWSDSEIVVDVPIEVGELNSGDTIKVDVYAPNNAESDAVCKVLGDESDDGHACPQN